jgi:hypothetical protein
MKVILLTVVQQYIELHHQAPALGWRAVVIDCQNALKDSTIGCPALVGHNRMVGTYTRNKVVSGFVRIRNKAVTLT